MNSTNSIPDAAYREDPRAYLFGLTIACPFGLEHPHDCQLCHIRGRSSQERQRWVRSLSDDEVQDLLEAHLGCLDAKRKGPAPAAAARSCT